MSFDFTPHNLLAISHLRFKRLWVSIGLLLILGVFLGSVLSVPSAVQGFIYSDKLTHLVVYAALMGWFSQIYRHDLTRLMLAISIALLGVGMEYLQGMVPQRQFEFADMVANSSGVLLAWALAYTSVGNLLPWIESRLFPSAVALASQRTN